MAGPPNAAQDKNHKITGAELRFVVIITTDWRDCYLNNEAPSRAVASNHFNRLTNGGVKAIHEFAKKPGGEPDEFLGGIFILDLKDKKASDKVKRWAEIEGRDKNERMLGHGKELPPGDRCVPREKYREDGEKSFAPHLDIERWNG